MAANANWMSAMTEAARLFVDCLLRGLRIAGFIAVFLPLCLIASPGLSQQPTAVPQQNPAAGVPPPEKLIRLKELLDDPAISAWLATQPASKPSSPQQQAEGMSALTVVVDNVRKHLAAVIAAASVLPAQLARVPAILGAEIDSHGRARVILLVLFAIGFGAFAEISAGYLLRRAHQADGQADAGSLVSALLPIAGFAAGIALAVLLFDWPPILQRIVIGYVLAYLGTRLVMTLGRFLLDAQRSEPTLAEPSEGPSVAPDLESGEFWYRRTVLLLGYFLFGWMTVEILVAFGIFGASRQLAAYAIGLGLLAIAILSVWQRPSMRHQAPRAMLRSVLLTFYCVILWLLWVAGMRVLLWLGLYAVILAPTLSVVGRGARAMSNRQGNRGRFHLIPVLVERAARYVVIVIAVLWLANVVGLQAESMARSDTTARTMRGLLSGIVILLVADLIWQIVKSSIDTRLAVGEAEMVSSDDDKARKAKLRTLLPIFRNLLAVVIGVVAVLMVLAGLGIQIAPLIAGAGIFGVAVGFGAQTLVKDVISGMFYLWDDAFRVGEYIQSGNYMGVVESFSLRSVRLRHHRGPVFTVPFGELGAVQNMSRDWVIDTMTIGVTYDTDVDKMKRVIKQIGKALQEDPEFAPHIIQTLKMKGVQQFGDYSIQIRLAMTTKPGEQFVIRRRAYAMIQTAFRENGIKFAHPTVQVAGDADKQSAAASMATKTLLDSNVTKMKSDITP